MIVIQGRVTMSSIARVLALGLFAASMAGPAKAAERRLFEKVADWEVERTIGDTSPNPCVASRSYNDEDDDDAENAVVFALNGSRAILVLGYENWSWDKDEKVKTPLAFGKKMIDAKASWTGDGKLLKGIFPDTIVPDLLAAKKINLRFDEGSAEFEIPGFASAYESLRRCDISASKPPVAAAPAPALPSEKRIGAYVFGLILQGTIQKCDVATTARQRSALDARVAALRPEMTLVEANTRQKAAEAAEKCPSAAEASDFQSALQAYNESVPEDFITFMDKKTAEEQAQATATPPKP